MFAQQNQLKQLFGEYGWELIETRDIKDWWCPEQWVIRSLWSPADCQVRVSFVTDPQLEDRTKAKLHIWSVTFSLKDASNYAEETYFNASIKPGWEKNLNRVFEELAKLRDLYAKRKP